MNDGPLCRCSVKAKRTGIRHNLFPGETPPSPGCDPSSNNAGRLFHYRVAITPRTNFALKRFPTVIRHDNHDFIFEGFSLFSHYKLPDNLPSCRIIRYGHDDERWKLDFNFEISTHFGILYIDSYLRHMDHVVCHVEVLKRVILRCKHCNCWIFQIQH